MKKRTNMRIATFVVVLAIAAGLVVPAEANDRPNDPFGGHTRELKKDDPVVKIWDLLRDKMLIEKGHFQKCLELKDCPQIHALVQRLDEIRQYQGKALLGHLNIAVNLMIAPAPSDWTTPLEAIAMKNGDCKSYSIAKYAGAQELGIPADDVRLVIVRSLRRSEEHMVVAVYQDGRMVHSRQLDQRAGAGLGKQGLRASGRFGLQRCPRLSFCFLGAIGANNLLVSKLAS